MKLGFRITRVIHVEMKLLADQRQDTLYALYTDALEHFLEYRKRGPVRYFQPPMKRLAIPTSILVPRPLADRVMVLCQQDQRTLAAVVETTVIVYLHEHTNRPLSQPG